MQIKPFFCENLRIADEMFFSKPEFKNN